MSVTYKDPFDDIGKIMKKFPQRFEKAKGVALFRIGLDMKSDASRLAPVKSGDLSRSIDFFPRTPGAMGDTVKVGTNKIYARIQDYGGTIRPKTSQYLTIPLPGTRGRIRDYPNGFFLRSKRGNVIYAEKKGNTGQIKPRFVLKKSVNIKGKPYLSKAFNKMVNGGAHVVFRSEFASLFAKL
jgi:hypothetical protein